MRRALGWIAVVVIGCQSSPTAARLPNVFLIVVDTLRADRLGAYGNTRGLTPFLDELAARGTVVREARAQAPWTNPSVASIFTSRYQSQHGIVAFGSVLAESEVTLAEVLRAAGYVTGAFSANGLIAQEFGFGQGFEHYEARLPAAKIEPAFLRVAPRAEAMAAAALAWLDAPRTPDTAAAPVFLYLHLMEPHAPYAPPAATLERLRGSRAPVDLVRVNEAMYLHSLEPVEPERLEEIVDAYDASVMALDPALRELFAGLERRGFLRDALVVVTADHGEEFQEHGFRGHGKTLYDEVLRVPLLVVWWGSGRSGTVERLVSSVDIAPTVLELAGVPMPSRFEGTSFAREVRGGGALGWLRRLVTSGWDERPEPAVYSELAKPMSERMAGLTPQESAVVLDHEKLIALRDGERRFYALDLDPGEQSPNIVEAEDRARLEARLAEFRTTTARDRSTVEAQVPDARTRQALEQLGYIE